MLLNSSNSSLSDHVGLKDVLDLLRQVPATSLIAERCRDLLAGKLEVLPGIPNKTGPKARKFLTIGMATANDYDGFYFTIQAIRLYHAEILGEVEFLVIDNSPDSPTGLAMKDYEYWANENYRYVPYQTHQSTAVRDLVFREATGEFVLCIDSHVLFPAGTLARFIQYCKNNPVSNDLLQGPLLDDAMNFMGMQFEPAWSGGMWGKWGLDSRGNDLEAEPFEIGMQGLGVFGCRREAWPGLNPRLNGFGGEEGYLHEKIRRAGGQCLCLPFLRWMHRFHRPTGARYPNTWEGRIRNYVLIHDELKLDPAEMVRHFEETIGTDKAQNAVGRAFAEIRGPFHRFDAVFCINLTNRSDKWESMQVRFQMFGIESLVRRFQAADTPLDRRIGCVLSHRRIVAEAKLQKLQQILVFEDENEFPANAFNEITLSLAELDDSQWQLSFVDGPGLAYHHTIFDALLDAVPDDPIAIANLVKNVQHSTDGIMQQVLRGFGVKIQ